jgi:hypothetical protein
MSRVEIKTYRTLVCMQESKRFSRKAPNNRHAVRELLLLLNTRSSGACNTRGGGGETAWGWAAYVGVSEEWGEHGCGS